MGSEMAALVTAGLTVQFVCVKTFVRHGLIDKTGGCKPDQMREHRLAGRIPSPAVARHGLCGHRRSCRQQTGHGSWQAAGARGPVNRCAVP